VKAVLTAFWRLFYAFAFYPILIGLFIWLYIKDAHWIFGVMIIAVILVIDPIWRIIFTKIISWRPKN